MIDATRPLTALEAEELDRRLGAAAAALPGVELELAELRREALLVAARRSAAAPSSTLLELAPPFLADFCLAHACRCTPPLEGAWRLMIERFSRELLATARACGHGAPEECVSTFFSDLWIARRSHRSLLDTYMGLGPLRAWLVLVFRRRLLRARRVASPLARLPEGYVGDVPGPEERLGREELLATVRPLLRAVLESLSERDRELVEARLLRSERGVDTARRFGVSPAYVSRRFKEVLAELRGRLSPPMALKGLDPEDTW